MGSSTSIPTDPAGIVSTCSAGVLPDSWYAQCQLVCNNPSQLQAIQAAGLSTPWCPASSGMPDDMRKANQGLRAAQTTQAAQPTQAMPWWAIVLIVLSVLLAVAAAIAIAVWYRKRASPALAGGYHQYPYPYSSY